MTAKTRGAENKELGRYAIADGAHANLFFRKEWAERPPQNTSAKHPFHTRL